jgi:hypothetical protein
VDSGVVTERFVFCHLGRARSSKSFTQSARDLLLARINCPWLHGQENITHVSQVSISQEMLMSRESADQSTCKKTIAQLFFSIKIHLFFSLKKAINFENEKALDSFLIRNKSERGYKAC